MKLPRLASSLLAAGLCTCLAAVAAEPPALGRLFMTPEWRAALERQRQSNVRTTRSIEGDSVRLDGVVVRSSGKSTVWINNRPQAEQADGSGVNVTTSRRHPDRATVATGLAAPAELQVGATLNPVTQETGGGLTAGEIRVRRAAPHN